MYGGWISNQNLSEKQIDLTIKWINKNLKNFTWRINPFDKKMRNINTLYLHSYYQKEFGYKKGDFPNAEWISERTVSLPLSAKLTDEDVEDVIEAVERIIKNHSLDQ